MKGITILRGVLAIVVVIGLWIFVIYKYWIPIPSPETTPPFPWPGPWCLSCPPMFKTLGAALILVALAGFYALGRLKEEFNQGKF